MFHVKHILQQYIKLNLPGLPFMRNLEILQVVPCHVRQAPQGWRDNSQTEAARVPPQLKAVPLQHKDAEGQGCGGALGGHQGSGTDHF